MRPADWTTVAVTGYLHALSHATLLSIPVFLTVWSEFSVDPATLGLLAATAYACFGLSSLPFGYLADRRPSGPLLAVSAGGIAVSLVAVALSQDLVALAGSLGALGLAAGIYHPTGLSLISRRVRETGRGFGWHGMGGSLGIALGPAFVGVLLQAGWSWRLVAGLLTVPALVGLILLLASRVGRDGDPPSGTEPLPARALLTPGLVLILLVYMFAGIAYWGSLTFLPQTVGTAPYVGLLALGAVGQVIAGRLADRERSERLLLGMSLAAASILLAFGVASSNPPAVLAGLYGFLLFSLEPLQNVLVTNEAPWGRRGLAFGMTFLAVFGLGSIGSALGGFLIQGGNTPALFAILAACLAASGACAVLAARHRRPSAG
jgi:predicted MFS family arabinose efflux permease